MMVKRGKRLTKDLILNRATKLRQDNKKIVLCYGHFNVIHPGHLRFLSFAKEQGDYLIAVVACDQELSPYMNESDFFDQDERAEGVAGLELVDAVYENETTLADFINILKPDVYVKGSEFEEHQDLIRNEIEAVEKGGGKVIFSSGDIKYSNSRFYRGQLFQKGQKNKQQFIKVCEKHKLDLGLLKSKIEQFKKLKLLVIGDTIVDEFVACDSLGVSSEAPVQVIRELESKTFLGGAAIVAKHIRSFGASCHFLSVLGNDATADFVRENLSQSGVQATFEIDETRPTTFKKRYMVNNQKLLRVSRLKQHHLSKKREESFIQKLEANISGSDGIIICDFVYGIITPKIVERICALAKQHQIKVFADVQCSSQIGDVSKFKEICLITPTEKEARIAMGDETQGIERVARGLLDKTKNSLLTITMGSQGLLAYYKEKEDQELHSSEFFPALNDNPVDVAGAGDAMLSGYALALSAGLNMLESTVLSSCMSAIAISRVGNLAIKPNELNRVIDELINHRSVQLQVY